MKKGIAFLLGLSLSFTLVFFLYDHSSGSNYAEETTEEEDNNELEIIKSCSLISLPVDTVEALSENADVGINGIITKTENYVYEDPTGVKFPYTKLTVAVDHVYKGGAELLNTEIIILEFGGVISKKDLGMGDKFPEMSEKELQKEVIVQSEGLENSRAGQEMVAFLMADVDMDTGFEFYQFTADYLSKFYLNKETGAYERLVPTEVEHDAVEEQIVEEINDEVNEIVEADLNEEEFEIYVSAEGDIDKAIEGRTE